jgi:hypothetical protein
MMPSAAAIAPLQQCSHRQFLLLKAVYSQYTTTGGIRQETRKKEPPFGGSHNVSINPTPVIPNQ